MALRLPPLILAALCPTVLAACSSGPDDAPAPQTRAPTSTAKVAVVPQGRGVVVLNCRDEMAPSTSAKGLPHTLGLASDGWAAQPGLKFDGSSRLNSSPYSFFKAYTYVTSGASSRTSIRITAPKAAWLFYTSGEHWGHMTAPQILQGATKKAELSQCPTPLTGYPGGILLKEPACVSLTFTAHPPTAKKPISKLRRIPMGKSC